jgi:hypothetical protein
MNAPQPLAIGYDTAGHPRTFRVARAARRQAAYRRLAAAILGLDIETLASGLRAARLGNDDLPRSESGLRHAA